MRVVRTLLIAVLTWTAALPISTLVSLQPRTVAAADVADLQDQLEAGLKARRPVEFRFIARVVRMVRDEDLPLKLVLSTFQWARKKARKDIPFPYFQRALKIRAAKLGIRI